MHLTARQGGGSDYFSPVLGDGKIYYVTRGGDIQSSGSLTDKAHHAERDGYNERTKVIVMPALFRNHCLLPLLMMTIIACPSASHAGEGQLRMAKDDAELRAWLENMVWHHRYSMAEIQQVTGLDATQLKVRLTEFNISDSNRPPRVADRLLMLPYPGGRHPRIGFLDGAVDPQRETKLSVFCPWDDDSYVVMDVPEAIWSDLGLTYLAHTHVKTIWDLQGTQLEQQEWQHRDDGSFEMQRRLPNGIEFGTTATTMSDHIVMTMFLKNGTKQPLSDLRVQNCVMLKGAKGFDQQTNENKKFADGYAVAGSADGTRWIISGWNPIHRAWGNARCPCLHSDPKFPDCAPGETQTLRGWFSFYQGTDIQTELKRIEATGWRQSTAKASD